MPTYHIFFSVLPLIYHVYAQMKLLIYLHVVISLSFQIFCNSVEDINFYLRLFNLGNCFDALWKVEVQFDLYTLFFSCFNWLQQLSTVFSFSLIKNIFN